MYLSRRSNALILLLPLIAISRTASSFVFALIASTPNPHRSSQEALNQGPVFTEITPEEYTGELPTTKLAYPFCYEPHPIAVWASDQLKEQLEKSSYNVGLEDGQEGVGKMFGVLVVKTQQGQVGYLKAFSGTLPGAEEDGFVPMVYSRFDADGFFRKGEAELNAINAQVDRLENSEELIERRQQLAIIEQESKQRISEAKKDQKKKKKERNEKRSEMKAILDQHEYLKFDEHLKQQGAAIQRHIKALKSQSQTDIAQAQQAVNKIEDQIQSLKDLRKQKSNFLQDQLFEQYQFLNRKGEKRSLLPIFEQTPLKRPPAGAGDCAAPKLFQYAFANQYHPIALAEFWWGKSPALEVRKHNYFYPACRGKCEPILGHMLQGLPVESNPLEQIVSENRQKELEILYEDDCMVVVNKPNDMLSVPGRLMEYSVYSQMKNRYPNATGPLLVHRLDMSTSGILVVAKDSETHKQVQAQFIDRSVKKRYTSLLEGECQTKNKGKIDLPLSTDYLNRPMQKIDFENGKSATTYYEVLERSGGRTRVYFYPATGRTHQLRVHAAHAEGLNAPIVGDDIYGKRDERLFLHAGFLELTHPVTQKRISFIAKDPF